MKTPLSKQINSSPMEKCSLVCHLVTFPIGLLYILWVSERLEAYNVAYYPPREWAIQIPVSALFLFFAIPILYFSFNSLTVPSLNSLDLIEDEHSRKPTPQQENMSVTKSSVPEICDLDPATLMWSPRKSEMKRD